MDERESADRLDRFLDGLARDVEGDESVLDPAVVRIARRYRTLGQLPAPAGAGERVWQRLDAAATTTGVGSPLVFLPGRAASPNGRLSEAEVDADRRISPDKRHGRTTLELAAAVLLIAILGVSALGAGQTLTRLHDFLSSRAERNVDVRMYGGDSARTGVMPGPGPKTAPVERWRATLPGAGASVAQSAPLVAGELIVVAQPNGVVVAFDRSSGAQRWRWQSTESLRFSAAPAVDGGLVFVGAQDGTFVALDVATGAEVWRVNLGATISAPAVVDGVVYVGLGSNPAVADGVVYVVGGCSCTTVVALDAQTGSERWRFQNADAYLFAVDATSGEERWRYDAAGVTLAAPSVADGTVYTVSSIGTVLAIDAKSGERRWQQDIAEANGATGFGATPAIHDKTVLVSSRNGTLTALDAHTGTLRWQRKPGGSLIASPTVSEGTVYVGDLNGTLTALDEADGAVRWSFTLSGLIGGPITVTGGAVYLLTGDGTLISLANAA